MRALVAIVLVMPAWADTGNAVCARCHPAIAKSYAGTGMAQTSGRTGQSTRKESFGHANVTPDYKLQIGETSRQLEWYIGSGRIGRSYLFRKGGQLFQAPLSYYAEPRKWDVSPGYENKPYLEMTRAVDQGCLQCHTSRPAFVEGGVSCERCHGPGEKHAAQPARTNIVNPVKLAPRQRDSVCAQCHLTGAARIARAGRERGSFTPGSLLSDSIAVFVWDTPGGEGPTATSHFEKLARSRCKQASGDKLWCGSCHTPHADSNRAHYNEQCQSCHRPAACKRSAGSDCITCHMPKSAATQSIEHLAFTDHSIPRRQGKSNPAAAGALKEFWTGQSNPRDTALAYAVAHLDEAYPKLRQAVAANPRDIPLLTELAQYHERRDQDDKAAVLYTQILQLDPTNTMAAVNLGTYKIRRGLTKEAIALWLRALAKNPALIGARMNLAVAQYQSGDAAAARASLKSVLDYEPEHPAAKRMLEQLEQ
ncbi:MAG: tetratricopeptide repeat protein [Acidobacteria bacterium]|nr:tetratricopeptide repeat protein [Acidobacteriota bacterium]